MEAEIGQFALVLALMFSILQATVPMLGAVRRDYRLMSFGHLGALSQFALISLAFVCLTYAFVTSDFSLLVVATNSNSAMPTLFRVTGVWGNHEGSLLLWVLILAAFGAAVAVAGHSLPATLKARVLAVQAMITTGFLALIIFTSNPFERLHPAPPDGQELNPLLQDIGLAIHPPFLYLGYVGFSITFAFAIAALLEGRVDAAWARMVRPWVLAAWTFLTIGITLGSFWAYYELGWGGFWFWDPVENASFMPWLVGTALLHSALVVERRQALIVWTLLLAILTFSLSLIGTFLVRSGVLTSVHAFASDPARGVGVLTLLVLATGGGLTLFALRASTLRNGSLFSPVSREGGLVLNNIFLITAAGTVFLGTFYPLFVELLSTDKISVGAPYFNKTFVPLMVPLLLAVVAGPFLRWKRDSLKELAARLKMPALVTVVAFVLLAITGAAGHVLAISGVAMGVWLVVGSVAIFTARIKLFSAPLQRSLELARNTPRATYGLIMAHAGLGLAVIGIISVSFWSEEQIAAISPSQTLSVGGYDLTLNRVAVTTGPNFEAERASFDVMRNGKRLGTLTSERRFYPVAGRVTTEAGIRSTGLSNLYVAIGEANDAGKWVVRLYWHPFALLIWIGPFLMAAGGLVSLADRRFRIGAPLRAARPALSGA